jgi:hypothetical protein
MPARAAPLWPHARHAAPHVGDHVHDRAAMLLHALLVGLARDQETAGEIVGDHGIPALLADHRQRHRILAAGIVDQAVDAAVFLENLRDVGAHRLLVTDVEGAGCGATAVLVNLGEHCIELLALASADDDVRAQCGEFVRGAAADAGAAAGDDDGLAGEQTGAEGRAVRHALLLRRWLRHRPGGRREGGRLNDAAARNDKGNHGHHRRSAGLFNCVAASRGNVGASAAELFQHMPPRLL